MSKKIITFYDSQKNPHEFPIVTPDYGVCASEASAAEKTVVCEDFALFEGAEITVNFENGNTAAEIALNINESGARAVVFPRDVSAGVIVVGSAVGFVYDGAQWLFKSGCDATIPGILGSLSVDVEGTVLALPSSAGKALRDYKIYGNSEQDGTPSTETSVAIQSVGDYNEETGNYDVPVTVRGKNYGNFEEMLKGEAWRTDASLNLNGYWNYPISGLEPNTTYTVSVAKNGFAGVNTGMEGYYVAISNTVGGWYTAGSLVHYSGRAELCRTSLTVTSSDEGKLYIAFYNPTDERLATFFEKCPNFMIELGGTATDYEPYIEPVTTTVSLDAPLRRVGEAADYMDYKTGRVNYRVAECVLTGNESWAYVADGDYFKLALSREANTSAMESSLCSHYVYGDATLDQSFWIDGTEQALCVKDARFTNEDELKTWLQSEEVRIIYPTLLAMGTLMKLPAIDTNLYDNVISIGTSVQPSNVKVTYFKKSAKHPSVSMTMDDLYQAIQSLNLEIEAQVGSLQSVSEDFTLALATYRECVDFDFEDDCIGAQIVIVSCMKGEEPECVVTSYDLTNGKIWFTKPYGTDNAAAEVDITYRVIQLFEANAGRIETLLDEAIALQEAYIGGGNS